VAGGSIKEDEGTFFKPKPSYFCKKNYLITLFFYVDPGYRFKCLRSETLLITILSESEKDLHRSVDSPRVLNFAKKLWKE
jgi:hypothetical protein